MGLIGTILDIIAGLIMAFGGIGLLHEIYSSLAWRKVEGRVVAWTPAIGADGTTVIGHKAQVSFDADGTVREMECRGTSEEAAMTAYPVGASVPLRYPAGTGEMPEIRGSLRQRFAFALGAMLLGLALFAVSTFIG